MSTEQLFSPKLRQMTRCQLSETFLQSLLNKCVHLLPEDIVEAFQLESYSDCKDMYVAGYLRELKMEAEMFTNWQDSNS